MPVLVSGVTPKCCPKNACINKSLSGWAVTTTGGTETLLPGGGVQLTSGGSGDTIVIADSSVAITPFRDFCFEAVIQIVSGADDFGATVGLRNTSANRILVSGIIGSTWKLLLSNNGATTTLDLGISVDTSKHTVKVCKRGGTIAVTFDGTSFAFAVPANYPSVNVSPHASIGSTGVSVYSVFSYCLLK